MSLVSRIFGRVCTTSRTRTRTRLGLEALDIRDVPASRSIGNPFTASDDVIVDGKIITAENFDSAMMFGHTIADYLLR